MPELSLSDFIAWLKTKPAAGRYTFNDIKACVGFLYLQDRGMPVESCGVQHWGGTDGSWNELPFDGHSIFFSGAFAETFGDCLARAEAALIKETSNAL